MIPRDLYKKSWNQFNHIHQFTQLPIAAMSAKPYIKVSLFIKKLPNISHEQFRAHWKGPHVDIAMKNDTFVRLVRKYNQVHILPELKEQAKQFGQTNDEFDGIAEVWPDNIDAWNEIAADKEFVAKILRRISCLLIIKYKDLRAAADEKLFLQHPSGESEKSPGREFG